MEGWLNRRPWEEGRKEGGKKEVLVKVPSRVACSKRVIVLPTWCYCASSKVSKSMFFNISVLHISEL